MERLLIVDDDRSLQRALTRLFEAEGFNVQVEGDGKSALEAFSKAPLTAIILDLRLPVIPGQDVCRAIRQQSSTVPIVILSATTDLLNKVSLLELGADDYITKPFSPRELLARVRAAIRHAPRLAAHDLVAFDGVCVNFTSMDITLDQQPITLTALDFKILKYFIQNARRVISRSELLREVTGCPPYASLHSVNDHISHLRHKLERDPVNPIHFLTVHRVGYKFVP